MSRRKKIPWDNPNEEVPRIDVGTPDTSKELERRLRKLRGRGRGVTDDVPSPPNNPNSFMIEKDDKDDFFEPAELDDDTCECQHLDQTEELNEFLEELENVDWELIKNNIEEASNILYPQVASMMHILKKMKVLIEKKNKERINPDVRARMKFLGVQKTKDLYSYASTIGSYKIYLTLYALTNLFGMGKDKVVFKCHKVKNEDDNGNNVPPQYGEIKIDYEKTFKILTKVECFCEYKSKKFVIYFYISPSGLNIFIDVKKQDTKFVDEILKVIKDYAEKNNFYKNKKLEMDHGGGFQIMKRIDKGWDDIIIDPVIKSEIEDNLINLIKQKDVYEANGLPLKRGIILEGSYGLGKTLLCQILCEVVECTVFFVTPKALNGPELVKHVYNLASDFAPSLVILEDLDTFGKDRSVDGGFKENILGELMQQLNGLEEKDGIITIASTNRIEVIEKALKDRPGRFDRVLHFKNPDEDQRRRMLEMFISKYNHNGIDVRKWASKTQDFHGAHLNDLVKTAIIQAVNDKAFIGKSKKVKLEDKHFEMALERINKVTDEIVGFRKAK